MSNNSSLLTGALAPDETPDANRELLIERLLDAPRELVWRVWTDSQHIALWWGPQGFTNTVSELDVRPGGLWRYVMHAPDGTDYPTHAVFLEVVPPERLMYLHRHSRNGSNEEKQFQVTVTFDEQNGKTHLTIRMQFSSEADCAEMLNFGAVEGMNSTLNRLEDHLSQMDNKSNA